jgi:hypothetical protein
VSASSGRSLAARSIVADSFPAGVKRTVMEGVMRGFQWDRLIQALVLVRLGQELGTESPLARAVHDVIRAVLSLGLSP